MQGTCYLIATMTQHLKDASGLEVEVGNIALFRADLSLNFKTQILMLKK